MKFAPVVGLLLLCPALGCDTETPTMVVVDNGYPAVAEGGDAGTERTVYRAWWGASLMPDAVTPGAEGTAERAVPGTDFAYAVLAPGWDPSLTSRPTRFLSLRSSAQLTANRGDTLHIVVSDTTFLGDCASGEPLTQDDADFITQRIFPNEFQGVTYDASTCLATSP